MDAVWSARRRARLARLSPQEAGSPYARLVLIAAGRRYVVSTDYTSVPLLIFFPLFMVGVTLLSIIFGQLRKSSGSVWLAVLMHGMANALGFAILEGNLIHYNNELFGSIVPGSITTTLVYGLIAFSIWQRKGLKRSLAKQNMLNP